MLNSSTVPRPVIRNLMPRFIPNPKVYEVPSKLVVQTPERQVARGGLQASIIRREHKLPDGVLRPMEILKPLGAVIDYDGVKVFIATIDQVQAQQLLLCNVSNRKISKDHVSVLAQEIRLGWLLTNQGIGISREDTILDAQHRLQAVASGAGPITTIVVYGLDPLVQQVIDHGRVRTIRDDVEIAGMKKKYGREFVSYVKMCAELYTGYNIKVSSVGSFDQWYIPFKEGVEWALNEMARGSETKLAPVGGALAFAHKTNPEKVSEFGIALRDHEKLEKVSAISPEGSLHSWILRNHSDYGGSARLAIYTRVLNHLVWHLNGVKNVKGKKLSPVKELAKFFGEAHRSHPKLREIDQSWRGNSQRF